MDGASAEMMAGIPDLRLLTCNGAGLEANFAAFGRVTKWMDVVLAITPRDPARGGTLPPGDKIKTIEIVEGRTSELQGKLDHGRIDALLGPGVARDADDVRLFEEGYGVAMATAHPLAHRASVTAEDIAGETMIVRRQCEALPLTAAEPDAAFAYNGFVFVC